jgi:DNA polymerase V
VAAGFPSPAEDYIDRHLDLHEHLVKNNAATFFTRASGNFMIGAGINDGDMLIVDRSLDAWHGKIVVAAVEGELTVKYLARKNGRVFIVPANEEYPELDIIEQEDIMVWGVVAYVIHKVDAAALDMK